MEKRIIDIGGLRQHMTPKVYLKEDNNIVAVSNIKFISKICTRYTNSGPSDEDELPPPDETENTFPIHEIRMPAEHSFIPETWLWDLISTSKNGKSTVETRVPTTIANWRGNVVCISKTSGVAISNIISINATESFLVDLIFPYSIKSNPSHESFYVQLSEQRFDG